MGVSPIWFFLFAVAAIVMFFLVPIAQIKALFPFGLGGGFVVAGFVQYLGVELFELWQFNFALIAWRGIPLGILFLWVPPTIMFAYFWPRFDSGWTVVLLFAIGTAVVTYGAVVAGYREYLVWSLGGDFVLALVIHAGLAGYLIYNRQRTV